MSLSWTTPVWMWPLLLVLAAGAVIWTVKVYRQSRPAPRPRLRSVLLGLRTAALLLLVLAVAQPVLSRLWRQEDPGRLVYVFEDSGSMSLAQGTEAEGEDQAENAAPDRWLAALDFSARLDAALAARGWTGEPIRLRGNGLQPVQEFRFDDPVITDPVAHGTDLNRLLRQVADHTVGLPVRAVVLFSDGQETRQSAAGRTPGAGRNSLSGNPRLVVMGAGNPVGSADRLIKDLRYPDTAYAGDEIVVELAVTHRFLEGQNPGPVTVSLTEGDRQIVDETFNLDRATTVLEIPFPAGEEGLRVFELEVSPLDNERFLANNKVSLAVNVRRGRSRILLLADKPGWDLRFLAQAALAEPRVELAVVQPSALGAVFADSMVTWQEPSSAQEWNRWDAVILYGWGGLNAGLDWDRLGQAVSAGLGLLVLPSPETPGQRVLTDPPPGLASILPVTAERWRWVEADFQAETPAAAAGHPILQGLGGTVEAGQDSRVLAGLPPLRRVVGVQTRPGALLLLDARQRERGGSTARLPLLAADAAGQGRVLWFGGRRLWELAFWEPGVRLPGTVAAEPQAARRLVQNLLVWLAAGQDESGLVFTGRRAFYQEGERVTLAAQWRDMRGQPVLDKNLSLIMRELGPGGEPGPERTFSMQRPSGSSGAAEVQLPPLPPGNYAVRLQGEGDPPVPGPEEFLVVTAHSVEETQVRQDQRRLQQLAGDRGGTFHQLSADQALQAVATELSSLDWSSAWRERRVRLDFWAGWPFLAAMVVLLGMEWYLRRRNGLL